MSRPGASELFKLLESTVSTVVCIGEFTCGPEANLVATLDPPSASAESLPADLRADVALVDAACIQDETELLPLLARLRDVHASQVIVIIPSAHPSHNDLVALGFEARKSPSGDGLVFVWDPAVANRPREWNNSKHWANPENFSRYRW